jgi:purine-nucleoside phosphorylase
MTQSLFERAEAAADAVRGRVGAFPPVAIVLGSGLGEFADRLADRAVVPYETIPHFPTATVAGHRGNLVVGSLGAARAAVLQGRLHYYEGHDFDAVTFPVRLMQRLGVRTLILTAAVGAIEPALRPGQIVCVTDHLNLLGANPLRGPNDDRFGTRFPDMTGVYAPGLRAMIADEARSLGIDLGEGVYAAVPGPSYETPAEIRMLRTLGADVVGMSTVPEAIAARHAGMDVLALAIVSNWAAGISESPITHEEVLQAGRDVAPKLAALLEAVVTRIAIQSPDDRPTSGPPHPAG